MFEPVESKVPFLLFFLVVGCKLWLLETKRVLQICCITVHNLIKAKTANILSNFFGIAKKLNFQQIS